MPVSVPVDITSVPVPVTSVAVPVVLVTPVPGVPVDVVDKSVPVVVMSEFVVTMVEVIEIEGERGTVVVVTIKRQMSGKSHKRNGRITVNRLKIDLPGSLIPGTVVVVIGGVVIGGKGGVVTGGVVVVIGGGRLMGGILMGGIVMDGVNGGKETDGRENVKLMESWRRSSTAFGSADAVCSQNDNRQDKNTNEVVMGVILALRNARGDRTRNRGSGCRTRT